MPETHKTNSMLHLLYSETHFDCRTQERHLWDTHTHILYRTNDVWTRKKVERAWTHTNKYINEIALVLSCIYTFGIEEEIFVVTKNL